jgi:hypothetical protein
MANNTEVVQAWLKGRKAKSQNIRGGLSTDGFYLYSYHVVIAEGSKAYGRRIYDYTKGGKAGFYSMTTSRHVRLAKRALESESEHPVLNRSKFIYGHS